MHKKKFLGHLFFILAMCTSLQVHCADTVIGSLIIKEPRARATSPGAKVAAGYLSIENIGDQDERLVTVNSEFAQISEIHEMKMEGDVAKMRPLNGGLEIPAGAQIDLNPGGLHIMFMKLQQQLQDGELHPVVLNFKLQGKVRILFEVHKNPSIEASGHHGHNSHTTDERH